jgi:hypothetical protein
MQRIVKLVWSVEQYVQKGLERTIGRPAQNAPTGSLFPEQVETTMTPALEVIWRLKEAKLSEAKFLELMQQYGFADCDLGDITMGDFTIGKMEEADLELALKNWPRLIRKNKSAN